MNSLIGNSIFGLYLTIYKMSTGPRLAVLDDWSNLKDKSNRSGTNEAIMEIRMSFISWDQMASVGGGNDLFWLKITWL